MGGPVAPHFLGRGWLFMNPVIYRGPFQMGNMASLPFPFPPLCRDKFHLRGRQNGRGGYCGPPVFLDNSASFYWNGGGCPLPSSLLPAPCFVIPGRFPGISDISFSSGRACRGRSRLLSGAAGGASCCFLPAGERRGMLSRVFSKVCAGENCPARGWGWGETLFVLLSPFFFPFVGLWGAQWGESPDPAEAVKGGGGNLAAFGVRWFPPWPGLAYGNFHFRGMVGVQKAEPPAGPRALVSASRPPNAGCLGPLAGAGWHCFLLFVWRHSTPASFWRLLIWGLGRAKPALRGFSPLRFFREGSCLALPPCEKKAGTLAAVNKIIWLRKCVLCSGSQGRWGRH